MQHNVATIVLSVSSGGRPENPKIEPISLQASAQCCRPSLKRTQIGTMCNNGLSAVLFRADRYPFGPEKMVSDVNWVECQCCQPSITWTRRWETSWRNGVVGCWLPGLRYCANREEILAWIISVILVRCGGPHECCCRWARLIGILDGVLLWMDSKYF